MTDRSLSGHSLGAYRINEVLGRGGMGVVYAAHHERADRRAAVKVLGQHMLNDEDHVRRFLREGKIAANLDHENIVRVFDVGESDGCLYIAMEHVDGSALSSLLHEHGPIDPRQAVQGILQAARGLAAAHAQGVVHRDIKPANILVTKGGQVKLADFGLAKAVAHDSALTLSGMLLGTPKYMSPEQCRGGDIDSRSDLYSLGVVLFEMLAGEVPFKGDSVPALMHAIMKGGLPSVCAKNDAIPLELEQIVTRMCALDPADRYQSATELIDDLKAFVAGRTTKASELHEASIFDIPDILGDAPPISASTSRSVIPREQTPRSRWLIIVGILAAGLFVAALIFAVAGSKRSPGVEKKVASKSDYVIDFSRLTDAERRPIQVSNASYEPLNSPALDPFRVNFAYDLFSPGIQFVYKSKVDGVWITNSIRVEDRIVVDNGITEYSVVNSFVNGRDSYTNYYLMQDNVVYIFFDKNDPFPTYVFSYPLYLGKDWSADLMSHGPEGEAQPRHATFRVTTKRTVFADYGELEVLIIENDANLDRFSFAEGVGMVEFRVDVSEAYPNSNIERYPQLVRIESR